jgi:CheY-like chemotaxis protein
MKMLVGESSDTTVWIRLRSILLVENNAQETHQVRQELKRLKVRNHVRGVETVSGMIAYLNGIDQYGDRSEYPLPAVIVLDLDLPGVDGFIALEWLQAHAEFCKIPVIVIETTEHLGALKAAVQVGADGWMTKPFTGEDFESIALEQNLAVEFPDDSSDQIPLS